jgi:hypothetical protein
MGRRVAPSCVLPVFALGLIGLAAPGARAGVLISEALANEVGSDTTGEWIEIYNNGALPVDISNWKIGDEEQSGGTSLTESIFAFPSGTNIAAGDALVIAVSATRFNTVYGFMPDFETSATDAGVPDLTAYPTWDPDGGQINMSNTNDQAVLLDSADAFVDSASWGNTFSFNPGIALTTADGQSFTRIDPNSDTDTAADWGLGPTSTVAAERSTPGAVPEPASLALASIAGVSLLARRRRRRD